VREGEKRARMAQRVEVRSKQPEWWEFGQVHWWRRRRRRRRSGRIFTWSLSFDRYSHIQSPSSLYTILFIYYSLSSSHAPLINGPSHTYSTTPLGVSIGA